LNTLIRKGVFGNEEDLLAATREVRAHGFDVVDVFSPYAIHGIEEAMGLKRSRLGWVCFLAGAAGTVLALYFQFWTSAVDWPIDVGGKPFDSLPAFVPVTFEFTVLLAGLGTVAALLIRCGLWPGRRVKLWNPRITDDRFVLLVRERTAEHAPEELSRLMERHHVLETEEVVA